MQLLETEFSQTVRDLIDFHLLQQNSIPAFLSAVTLELFGRQTLPYSLPLGSATPASAARGSQMETGSQDACRGPNP
ncbi:hypothetical protein E2320_012243 [Naja naja]|nr:hypothetical protein E2320_012243 [Naja naja]